MSNLLTDINDMHADLSDVWADGRDEIHNGEDVGDRLMARFVFFLGFVGFVIGGAFIGLLLGLFGAFGFLSRVITIGTIVVSVILWISIGVRSRFIDRD